MTLPVRDARLLMSRYRDALIRIMGATRFPSRDASEGEQLTSIGAIAAVSLGVATEEESRTYNRLRRSPIVPMRGPGTAGTKERSK